MQLLLPELLLALLLVLHLMECCSISTSVEIAKLRLIDRKIVLRIRGLMVNPGPFLLPVILQDGLFCSALSPIPRRTIPSLEIFPMETTIYPTLV